MSKITQLIIFVFMTIVIAVSTSCTKSGVTSPLNNDPPPPPPSPTTPQYMKDATSGWWKFDSFVVHVDSPYLHLVNALNCNLTIYYLDGTAKNKQGVCRPDAGTIGNLPRWAIFANGDSVNFDLSYGGIEFKQKNEVLNANQWQTSRTVVDSILGPVKITEYRTH